MFMYFRCFGSVVFTRKHPEDGEESLDYSIITIIIFYLYFLAYSNLVLAFFRNYLLTDKLDDARYSIANI